MTRHSYQRSSFGLCVTVALLGLPATGCMSQSDAGRDSAQGDVQKATQQLSAATTSGLQASVRRTSTTIEIEVTSDTPFQNGAVPPVLVIGNQAFGLSRTPPDGRQDTLIFMLATAEYDAVAADGEVSVGYLAPGARLALPTKTSAVGARSAQTAPLIRVDQVARQRRVGVLRKSTMEVVP